MMTRPFHLPGRAPEVRRLDAVLQKCLAIEKEKRFASIAEMRRELIPAIQQTIQPANRSTAPLDPDLGVTQKYDIES
jgi:hypothetical protein